MATIPSLHGLTHSRLVEGSNASSQASVDLAGYRSTYSVGRGRFAVWAWYFINALVFLSPFVPHYGLKRWLLRRFGATVGRGVVIKPRVNIKYPWNVSIGDNTWIGEGAWIDSLGKVEIGANVCISQDVYLCTGSHDWSLSSFDLIVKPITVEDGAWLGCRTQVMGGVTVASHSVLAAGSTLSQDTEPYMIYRGNPAQGVKLREVREARPQPRPQRKPDRRYRLVFPEPVTNPDAAAGNLALARSGI